LSSPGFLRFFWEQELWDILLLSALVAVTYTGLLFLSLWILKRFVPGLQVRTLMVAVSLALGLFVVGFTTVNSVSHYLRFDPPGSGFERSTQSYQQFAFWAKTAVVAVYAAVLSVAALMGRWRGQTWKVAAGTFGVTLLFLVLSLPIADFINECTLGQPLIPTSIPRC
jgi:vacuolar-type H+-ATPase subunit I/STV1